MTCCFNCTFVYDIFKSIITLHFSLFLQLQFFVCLFSELVSFLLCDLIMEPTLKPHDLMMEPTIPVRPMWAPSSSHTTKSRPIPKKTSKREIVTVEKRKNVRWKLIVDLEISYTNVQLQQQVIHEKFTWVQRNMTLSNDITITKSHLDIENTQMRNRYQNTSWK